MNYPFFRKLLAFAVLSTYGSTSLAAWDDVETELLYEKIAPSFDTENETLLIQAQIINRSTSTLEGPFRLLVEDPSLTLLNASGTNGEGVQYINLPIETLSANQRTLARNTQIHCFPPEYWHNPISTGIGSNASNSPGK